MHELQKITSRDNQRLISARRIRDGHGSDKMFVEGKRLAAEAVRSELKIAECFVSGRFVTSSENSSLLQTIVERSRFTFEIPDRIFSTIAATENSQGIAVIAERPDARAQGIELRLGTGRHLPLVLLLFEINNPSNLGAILRTAEAADVAGIVVSTNSTDAYSPKALRASMGAAFRLPIWTDADYHCIMSWANRHGLATTAATAAGAVEYSALDWRSPRLLILGSEAHGLGSAQLESVSERTCVPMENDVESLNVAVATGIFLYEARRQNVVSAPAL